MNAVPASARLLSTLAAKERLALLQEHDPLREWTDVNELRTCMCCSRKLAGRQIQIWSDSEKLWFRCPSSDCAGTLSDFARAGDPLFDEEVWEDWCKSFQPHALDEPLDKAG